MILELVALVGVASGVLLASGAHYDLEIMLREKIRHD